MGNIPLHAKAVPRLDVGAQTSNSSISDPCDLSPRDVELTALPPQAAPREHPPQAGSAVVGRTTGLSSTVSSAGTAPSAR